MSRQAASKFLSYVLRHHPEAAGVTLDEAGWVEVDALLACPTLRALQIDGAALEILVAENDKRRFALSPCGLRIRAVQGHSFPVALGLEQVDPPPLLYHGTSAFSLPGIDEHGLLPMSRTHVHLSADFDTAQQVALRHGKHCTVLTIQARRAAEAGTRFYRAENGVWLADQVPRDYLEFARSW